MNKWIVPSTRANGEYILADAWNVECVRNQEVLRTRHSEGFLLVAPTAFHVGDKTQPVFRVTPGNVPKWDTVGGAYCAQVTDEPDFFTGDIGGVGGWIVPEGGTGIWRLTYFVGSIKASTFASANGFVIVLGISVNEEIAQGSSSPDPLFNSTAVQWGVQSVAVTSTAFNYGFNATHVQKLSSGDVMFFAIQASNLPTTSGAPHYHQHNSPTLVAEFLGST